MPASTTTLLDPYAGLVVNVQSTLSFTYKNIAIPSFNNIYYNPSTLGRVLYFKEATELPGISYFNVEPAPGETIQNSTLLYLNSNTALTIQAFSTNAYSILGAYGGTNVFSTQNLPVNSVVVNPSMKQGNLFVDLRYESKTILLPPISNVTFISYVYVAPFYTIKDIYGNAAVSTLFLSTSQGNTLERSSINNAIAITENYASIDLAANSFSNKWHILNYFNGTI